MEHTCSQCIHRRYVPGSTHSRCVHPVTEGAADHPLIALAATMGKHSGLTVLPVATAAAALRITAHEVGVARGWFLWPVDFDPVWLIHCDGFTPTTTQEGLGGD